MRIAVIGSRSIGEIDFDLVGAKAGDVIVSGGAKGPDSLAEDAALARGIPVIVYVPDYAKHGRAAPHVRNRTIARNCDRLVAFWDGQSRGTISTVEMARRLGKPVQVITVQSQNN